MMQLFVGNPRSLPNAFENALQHDLWNRRDGAYGEICGRTQ